MRRRITKQEWQRLGGFRNPHLFRKQAKGGGWTYWAAGPEAFDYNLSNR